MAGGKRGVLKPSLATDNLFPVPQESIAKGSFSKETPIAKSGSLQEFCPDLQVASTRVTPWKDVDYAVRMVSALDSWEAESYLKSLETGKPELYQEVIWFLTAQKGLSGFMESPVAEKIPSLFESVDLVSSILTPRGDFKILDLLGEGGMGKVYLAQRLDMWGKKVALKTLREDVTSDQAPKRFENESRLMSELNHPAFPHVYEYGLTVDEKPYFTMEYIKGETLAIYCRSKKLSVRERLGLFAKICDGMAYAHQQGIIHRDLKPANVLVTSTFQGPQPKIIDFGIAKSVAAGMGMEQTHTRIGNILGTPAYMSPEQWLAAHQDVDLRSDVYALGVILFEVLTGLPPHDLDVLEDLPAPNAWQQFRGGLVKKPSERLLEATYEHFVQEFGNGGQRKELLKKFRRELDWIVTKAMALDRNHRYASVEELAADVRAYLANQPISPKRNHKGYLMSKFTQRYGSHLRCILFTGLFILASNLFWRKLSESPKVSSSKPSAYIHQVLQAFEGIAPEKALLNNPQNSEKEGENEAFRWKNPSDEKGQKDLLKVTDTEKNPPVWTFVKVGY